MPDPLSPERYAYVGGNRCPACLRKARLTRGGIVPHAAADTITRFWGCPTCGASWAAVYELTGYEGLCQPRKDPC